VRATLKLECSLYRDVFPLEEACLLKHGYSEKSKSIDVHFFFSNLKVFQEEASLPLKMRCVRLSSIASSCQALEKNIFVFTSCVSVTKYPLLDCFTDPQTAKEIFDFAVKAINPQVNPPRANCST